MYYRDNIGHCRNCGQRIMFVTMKSGKKMPVDESIKYFKLENGGKEKIVTPQGELVSCVTEFDGESDGFGYVSHFATCAGRKKKSA